LLKQTHAIIPTKRDEDGAFDLFACFDEEYIEIPPQKIAKIETGIATSFPTKYKAVIYERGSSGSVGLAIRSGLIDSGYRDGWVIVLSNVTDKTIFITKKTDKVVIFADRIAYPYTKAIAQFSLEEIPKVVTKEISWNELKEHKSERGLGAWGSTLK
jgi:dUTP pyrophosphatase